MTKRHRVLVRVHPDQDTTSTAPTNGVELVAEDPAKKMEAALKWVATCNSKNANC